MQEGYKRRKISESVQTKVSATDKRVNCDVCNFSFTFRHYQRYHKERCGVTEANKSENVRFTMQGLSATSFFNSKEEPNPEEGAVEYEVPGTHASHPYRKPVQAENKNLDEQTCENQDTQPKDHINRYSTFSQETSQGVDVDNYSEEEEEEEEHWVETEEQSLVENMEEAIAQDLDELREQIASRPLTVQNTAERFVKWLCVCLMVWQARYFISDVAIDAWLHFFKELLSLFAGTGGLLGLILTLVPSGIYGVNKLLGCGKDMFQKFVVCKKCYTLYSVTECVQQIEGRMETKTCAFVKYRWQKNALHSNPCGEKLLKEIILPSGKTKLYPFKWFCYRSLKESLAQMVMRPGFENLCEKWRQRKIQEGVLEDIMDGKIWKDFNGAKYNFFTQERCYGLMLNVDWFRPFKHVQYSVGAIYLTILNLPKSERFNRKNVILAGIIPHMGKEPKTNTFLSCLTQELQEAWDHGFNLMSANCKSERNFRLAFILVGCDIPACRKVCGFLGHAAYRGCSKCWKFFPGQVGQRDYSGFARENWPERTHAKHVEASAKIQDAKRRVDVETLERNYGLRYSVLLELPYFDIVTMHIVDPMHNLFLGTAKRMVEIWKEQNFITHQDMKCIQQRVDNFQVPSDMGNIPYKIQSGFSDFSADQWKNWTLYLSVPCLQGILAPQHLQVWKHFVRACYLLCSHVIAPEILLEADSELLTFCKMFETLYGREFVSPNVHLHGHLRECIMLYGPMYSFWLFSFERYNGILGKQPSNQRAVEVQLMRRFLKDGAIFSKFLDSTDEEKKLTECLLQMSETRSRGSLKEMSTFDFVELCRTTSCRTAIHNIDISTSHIMSYMKKVLWDLPPMERQKLQAMYARIYPTLNFTVVPICFKVKQLLYSGDLLGTKDSRSSRSSFIMAYWPDANGNINTNPENQQELAAGQISYVIEHNLLIADGSFKKHVLARVLWYQPIEPQFKDFYGFPVGIFYPKIFRPENNASFIPVQRIRCKMLTKTESLKLNSCTRDVLIAVPRDHFAGCQ